MIKEMTKEPKEHYNLYSEMTLVSFYSFNPLKRKVTYIKYSNRPCICLHLYSLQLTRRRTQKEAKASASHGEEEGLETNTTKEKQIVV